MIPMFLVACDEAFRTAVDRPLRCCFLAAAGYGQGWLHTYVRGEISFEELSSREHLLAQGELPKKTLCSPDACLHKVRIPLPSMRLNKSLTGEIIPMTWLAHYGNAENYHRKINPCLVQLNKLQMPVLCVSKPNIFDRKRFLVD
jgi:hypothetical protein